MKRLLVLALVCLAVISCKKDDDDDKVNSSNMIEVTCRWEICIVNNPDNNCELNLELWACHEDPVTEECIFSFGKSIDDSLVSGFSSEIPFCQLNNPLVFDTTFSISQSKLNEVIYGYQVELDCFGGYYTSWSGGYLVDPYGDTNEDASYTEIGNNHRLYKKTVWIEN